MFSWWSLTLLPLLLYIGFCTLLYLRQRHLLFVRQGPVADRPDEALWLETDQGKLYVSVLNPGCKRACIYFGGNAEAVDLSLPEYRSWLTDWSLYLVHYRGFGYSQGQPSEKHIIQDALLVFDQLQCKHNLILTAGRSLGSGVALQLAAQRPVQGLVIITPYDSLAAVAKKHYPLFPVNWLMKDTFHMLDAAAIVSVPTLMLIAEHDEVIPPQHARRLSQRFKPGLLEIHLFEGHNHGSISQDAQYIPTIQRFITRFPEQVAKG